MTEKPIAEDYAGIAQRLREIRKEAADPMISLQRHPPFCPLCNSPTVTYAEDDMHTVTVCASWNCGWSSQDEIRAIQAR